MLRLDPQHIHQLVEESQAILRPHFRAMDELESWLLTTAYGENADWDVPDDWPENVPFSFIALLLPRMTREAPRFAMRGDGSKRLREQVLGIQGSLNLLSRQQRLNRALIQGAMDYLLGFTCFFVDAEPIPAHRLTADQRRQMKGSVREVPEGSPARIQRPAVAPPAEDVVTPHWPYADHRPRGTYGWDQTAKTWSQVRFWWHDVVEDYEELVGRAEADPDHWDIENVKRLGELSAAENPYSAATGRGGQTNRRQVRYRMVYVPEGRITEEPPEGEEHDPEDGPPEVTKEPGRHEHGVWMTLGVPGNGAGGYQDLKPDGKFGEERLKGGGANEGIELAKPFYRVGSTNSPYKVFGPYIPASRTVPFSPLTVNRDQIRLWGDLAAAAARRMRRYSRQVLYDLKDASIREAINEAGDDDFVGIPGFETGRAQVVERGGLSQQDMAHMAHQQATVYRGLGMSETLQGNSTNNTATAEDYAARTGLLRIDDVVSGWEEGLAEVGHEMAWHMAFSDKFWAVLDEQAKVEMMMADMAPLIDGGAIDSQKAERMAKFWAEREIHVWQGGDFDSDHGLDFGLLRCEIEPYSMERRNLQEQQAALMALFPILAQVNTLVVQQPHFEWREFLRQIGRTFQVPDLEKMLHMDIAQQMSQLMIAEGLNQTATSGAQGPGAVKIGGPGASRLGPSAGFQSSASRGSAGGPKMPAAGPTAGTGQGTGSRQPQLSV